MNIFKQNNNKNRERRLKAAAKLRAEKYGIPAIWYGFVDGAHWADKNHTDDILSDEAEEWLRLAFDWIDEHLNNEAEFMVNTEYIYNFFSRFRNYMKETIKNNQ